MLKSLNRYISKLMSRSKLLDWKNNNFLQIAREGKWNVEIENVTDETGVLSIVGPKSAAVFADSLVNKDVVETWKFLDAKKVSNLSKSYCGDWHLKFIIGYFD